MDADAFTENHREAGRSMGADEKDPISLVLGGARSAFIAQGDCRKRLKEMPDNSVDAVVTDPPAGIAFMGKAWDRMQKEGMTELQAFQDFICEVFTEVYRVLKPGGHAVVWALPRTAHHTTMGVERAGFEIRDVVHHVFGTGFPKSLDVSKAIDKAGGISPKAQSSLLRAKREAAGMSRSRVAAHCGCTESSVRDWEEGRARATGAPLEFITPSTEYRTKLAALLGYTADERIAIGVSIDRRGDGSTYGLGHSGALTVGGATDAARQWQGWGTALKPAAENWILARKPLIGTVAANVLEHGTGAINVDGCRIDARGETWDREPGTVKPNDSIGTFKTGARSVVQNPQGRWPANFIHDGSDEVLELFPVTHGAGTYRNGSGAIFGGCDGEGADRQRPAIDGGGSTARFFYTAKASKGEKYGALTCGCTPKLKIKDIPILSMKDANAQAGQPCPICGEKQQIHAHPTVKSVSLMEWLIKLITPPGGLVLDPFTGSGSTGVAARRLGFRFLGMEQDKTYCALARHRVKSAGSEE